MIVIIIISIGLLINYYQLCVFVMRDVDLNNLVLILTGLVAIAKY